MHIHWKTMLTVLTVALAVAAGALAGCTGKTNDGAESGDAGAGQATGNTLLGKYTDEDLDDSWDDSAATHITLTGGGFQVAGGGAAAEDNVLTITEAGTYVLAGSLADGQVVVDAAKEDTVRLVLNEADLSCSWSAPLYGKKAGKVIVTLAEGTANALRDAAEYQYDEGYDEPDAALFCKNNLSINGSGALTVTGSYNNGIGCKDNLVLAGGSLEVSAPNHGIRGRDSLVVVRGSYTVDAGNDGLQSNNSGGEDKGWIWIEDGSFAVTAAHDAIQAETSLEILGGSYTIITGGGAASVDNSRGGMGGQRPGLGEIGDPAAIFDEETPLASSGVGQPQIVNTSVDGEAAPDTSDHASASTSYKGLKAGTNLTVSGGEFRLDCEDDGIHANGDISIGGGDFTIATGDDGIHADGHLEISGGSIDITTSYEGIEASTMTIAGGSISLVASDDGVNVAGGTDDDGGQGRFGPDAFSSSDRWLKITGGTLVVESSGDGIDINGNGEMSGGVVIVHGPTSGGDAAIDYDGAFSISGGTLIAVGSTGMAQAPGSGSTQPVLALTFSSAQEAGTMVHVADADGKSIISLAARKQFQHLVVSTPDMALGEAYTVYTGGDDSSSEEAALTTGSRDGTKVVEVTLADTVTSISDTGEAVNLFGGMPGGGGRGGGMGGGPGGERPAGGPPSGGFPGEPPADGVPGGGPGGQPPTQGETDGSN